MSIYLHFILREKSRFFVCFFVPPLSLYTLTFSIFSSSIRKKSIWLAEISLGWTGKHFFLFFFFEAQVDIPKSPLSLSLPTGLLNTYDRDKFSFKHATEHVMRIHPTSTPQFYSQGSSRWQVSKVPSGSLSLSLCLYVCLSLSRVHLNGSLAGRELVKDPVSADGLPILIPAVIPVRRPGRSVHIGYKKKKKNNKKSTRLQVRSNSWFRIILLSSFRPVSVQPPGKEEEKKIIREIACFKTFEQQLQCGCSLSLSLSFFFFF